MAQVMEIEDRMIQILSVAGLEARIIPRVIDVLRRVSDINIYYKLRD